MTIADLIRELEAVQDKSKLVATYNQREELIEVKSIELMKVFMTERFGIVTYAHPLYGPNTPMEVLLIGE